MSDHAFLAVDLSNDERHLLSGVLTEASPGVFIPGRRAPVENWHITLRFLGECTELQAEQVMHRLSEMVDAGRERVWCVGLGAFPKASKANVVYVALDDPKGILGYLGAICDEAAVDAGFEPENRPHVPHLTLSRLRPGRDVRSLFDAYGEFRVPIWVEGVMLMRTRRTRNGLHYEPIDHIPLA